MMLESIDDRDDAHFEIPSGTDLTLADCLVKEEDVSLE